MNGRQNQGMAKMGFSRKIRRWSATTGLLAVVAAACAGCDDQLAKDFRSAAAGQLQTGLTSILQGLVDGTFAVVDPQDSSGDTTDTSGADTSSSQNTP